MRFNRARSHTFLPLQYVSIEENRNIPEIPYNSVNSVRILGKSDHCSIQTSLRQLITAGKNEERG